MALYIYIYIVRADDVTVCNSNMLEKFFLPMPPPWREHLIAYLSNYVPAGDE